MLHIKHSQNNIYSIRYFFSSQFGVFLVHCLNGLCILLSNDLALHLQSGRQRVGERASVFREDCKFLREKERRGRVGESSPTTMHHTRHSDIKHLPPLNVKLQSVRRALSSVCALIIAGFNVRGFCGLAVIHETFVHERLDMDMHGTMA